MDCLPKHRKRVRSTQPHALRSVRTFLRNVRSIRPQLQPANIIPDGFFRRFYAESPQKLPLDEAASLLLRWDRVEYFGDLHPTLLGSGNALVGASLPQVEQGLPSYELLGLCTHLC